MESDIHQLAINTIRTLSMDAVQKANAGHPGTPMALAPLGYLLWQKYLNYDPENPLWPNRDRFVLSVGHASMLLYSLIHLAGVKASGEDGKLSEKPSLTLDDLKNFRQLKSPTPGHPEYHLTTGVETTTGPLGQGFANSVGMAIAEQWLAQYFNRPDIEIFNHLIYAIGGDGCMMEGVTAEAASLAGHLKLSNLCWFYDDNKISIEGSTDLAFSEDVGARFEAYGWHVLRVNDINNLKALGDNIDVFKKGVGKPVLVIVKSHIGYGAPNKQDRAAAHGEPLGADEIRLAKKFYGWPEDSSFLVPESVLAQFSQTLGRRGSTAFQKWTETMSRYKDAFPKEAGELQLLLEGQVPAGWDSNLPPFKADEKGLATRESSGLVMNAIAPHIPWFLGGAADLAPSTKTLLKFEEASRFSATNYGGRNLHFGIREHAMGAVTNGMALSYLRPYGATFLVFSDYQKPAIRLSALMELPNLFIFSHDSIGLGEDGPTHQPIEHLAGLRSIPGLVVLRPADANEVTEAWKVIFTLKKKPVALVLSRQAIPTFDRSKYQSADGVKNGAYILVDAPNGNPQIILISTGAEVSICLKAYEKLIALGVSARVVSMPSWDLFEAQPQSYKDKVLPPQIKARVSVEAGATFGWDRYVGTQGQSLGMNSFGASAPLKELFEHFGFTPDKIVEAARRQL